VHSILSVHNFYQQPGGEDRVFADEAALLEAHGHSVTQYVDDNRRVSGNALLAARNVVWNSRAFQNIRSLLETRAVDLVHFHNTFPLISPAGYFAAGKCGIPVVQTLHNYRLICPGATLLRNGVVCEECLDRGSLMPAVRHGCYRNSRPATAAAAAMLAIHRAADTWRDRVDTYIALSEFARQKFIAGGLPPERIAVKPNFVSPDPGIGSGAGGYALFVGRLAQEKGVQVLARAWQEIADIPLYVAGSGPLNTIAYPTNVTLLGNVSRNRIFELMRNATVLIFPSLWYECAPMTIVEAFACGLPVIASNIGSLPEFVSHEHTGLLFEPGNATDLAHKVRWAFEHPREIHAMRTAARLEFERKYTAERNYEMLTGIYRMAISSAQGQKRRGKASAA